MSTDGSRGARGRSTWLRAALVVVVLAVAATVALWPRSHPAPQATPEPQPAVDLAAARARADLPPCPQPATGAAGPVVPALRGVTATCLGDARPVDLGTALAGHTTLVNLWAAWCAPCRDELPVLAAYAARPGAARVLTVQTASAPADGLDLLSGLHVRLPTVTDGGRVAAALKPPPGLPASFVVRPDGTVHPVLVPRVFQNPDEVAAAVRG